MEDYIDFFVEVEGRTLVAVLTWDFDNWCLDGYYSVKGTDLSADYIFNKIHETWITLEIGKRITIHSQTNLLRSVQMKKLKYILKSGTNLIK